ncbi:hypothetical protein [Endozoicomonas ascidiicola]|uniref:hypothetical protein n=1 Tax=Endozoicomonas ascidiicola TaxID=1698521 RepID=UPI0012FC731F|nr:hypothetical protein [Endozoicomonas ascidiicola]
MGSDQPPASDEPLAAEQLTATTDLIPPQPDQSTGEQATVLEAAELPSFESAAQNEPVETPSPLTTTELDSGNVSPRRNVSGRKYLRPSAFSGESLNFSRVQPQKNVQTFGYQKSINLPKSVPDFIDGAASTIGEAAQANAKAVFERLKEDGQDEKILEALGIGNPLQSKEVTQALDFLNFENGYERSITQKGSLILSDASEKTGKNKVVLHPTAFDKKVWSIDQPFSNIGFECESHTN